jgi:hypothetical protein
MLTRCTTLCAVAVTALAGLAHASWVHYPHTSSITAQKPAAMPQLDCVKGFSKDYCNGTVYQGTISSSGCPDSSCKTLRITGATYDVNMVSNSLACGNTHSYCDEAPNGRLKVSSDFTIRLQPNCPYRGCWDGTYGEYQGTDGSVYAGTLMGTIGVGTHRAAGISTCSVNPGTRNCEKCYDVSFDSVNSQWRIGYEASFHGTRADTGEEVCISLSGDFFVRGDLVNGPIWASDWSVAGTADGIWLTFCP